MSRMSETLENLCFLSVMLLLQVVSGIAGSGSIVSFLPGFQGTFPFELETGYVGAEKSEDVQIFYYFVKSQRNAKEDPLVLWLTGGPGCSGLSGLLYEIGPFSFELAEFNGSLPTVILNPYSWTRVASVIFADMPVGTGFSYAKTKLASHSSDLTQVHHADKFLREWLRDHPEFLLNPVYITGDSYSGITIPPMVQHISNGNEEGRKPLINLQGYMIGNPVTNSRYNNNSWIPFAHGMGLIPDELYKSLMKSCEENFEHIDPRNTECLKYMQDFEKCISRLNFLHILEPRCDSASSNPLELFGKKRFIDDNYQNFHQTGASKPWIRCRDDTYTLSEIWANDKSVRQALHVREESPKQWIRCNYGIPYTRDIESSIKYHVSLGKKGYRSLIYSGDHDLSVPFLGTLVWIRSLKYSVVEDWRPWQVQGQVAGYTTTYSNRMTFATVKGGGHTAPEYKPAECFAMFKRWMNQEPL